jgi:hypothetical protein
LNEEIEKALTARLAQLAPQYNANDLEITMRGAMVEKALLFLSINDPAHVKDFDKFIEEFQKTVTGTVIPAPAP